MTTPMTETRTETANPRTYICTGCGSELNVLDQPAHNDAEHAIDDDGFLIQVGAGPRTETRTFLADVQAANTAAAASTAKHAHAEHLQLTEFVRPLSAAKFVNTCSCGGWEQLGNNMQALSDEWYAHYLETK